MKLIEKQPIEYIITLLNSKNTYKKIIKSLQSKNIVTIEDLFLRQDNPLWLDIPQKQFSRLCNELEREIREYIETNELNCKEKSTKPSIFSDLPDSILNINIEVLAKRPDLISPRLYEIFRKNKKKYLRDVVCLSDIEIIQLQGFKVKDKDLWIKFREGLYNEKDEYFYLQDDLELPFYEEERELSTKESLDLFFRQYINALEKTGETSAARIISDIYNSRGKVALENIEVGLGYERVRQIKEDILKVFSGEKYLNFKLEEKLLNRLNSIKKDALYKDTSFLAHISGYEDGSNDDIDFLASLLSLKVTRKTHFSNQQFLVKDGEGSLFLDQVNNITNVLQESIIPLSLDTILKKTEKDNMIYSILENHNRIESLNTDGILSYQLKWEYLPSVEAKAKRIIYESKIPISRDEILLEYNRRANLFHQEAIEANQLIIKKKNKDLFQNQSNGYWYFGKKKKSVQEFILEYIISRKGKVTFSEVQTELEKFEYKYPLNTIRTYILLFCRIAANDSNLFIHKDFTALYPEIELRKPNQKDVENFIINKAVEILTRCSDNAYKYNILVENIKQSLKDEGFSITFSNLYSYLNKYIELNILTRSDVEKDYIRLDKEELKKYDLEKLGKRDREPEYKKKIRSLVINYLKKEKNNEAYLKDLYDKFKEEIPESYSKNVFYKIFSNDNILKKKEEGRLKIIYLDVTHLPEPKSFQEEASDKESPNNGYEYITYIPYDLEKLKMKLCSELEGYFKADDSIDIQKAVNSFIEYLKVRGEFSSWGNGILKSIYDLFFSKSDYFDRESYLYRLVMNYEAFLKNICKVRDEKYDTANIQGLSMALDIFDETRKLRNRDSQVILESRFAKIYSTLRYYRNIYAHSANDISDIALFQQVKMNVDNIALYVYTAWLLRDQER